ncbi:MBL fold metallo-hydrolase [Leucobacter coleopterorum]|uniref:MBL fold metallo-hydrolase n=1 Tax=Leucobacter coleopterorum TaxID=2714933 RepID=A0ABX6JWU0_9MICO|nr:MBL fold metallo-hydrolase [Leucobacter coleopterorum]QIM18771.1 MBL fold metallo-hydrolase [Leucobacter coleopterorum]
MVDLQLSRLTANLHRLLIPGGPAHLLNAYIWLEDDEVTLIDTGWPGSAPLFESALAQLGRSRSDVVRIVLTHFHEDHTGSAAEIAGWGDVEVVAGALDAPFVAGTSAGPLPMLTTSERTIHAESEEPPHGPLCHVGREVRNGDLLDFAGGTRVLETQGHTPGSISLFLPAANAVLTGDAVAEFNGEVILGVFNTDRKAAQQSLEIIADTGAQIAGFGLGNPILKDAHRLIREARVPFAV